jgi:hypothetical protein
MAGVENSFFIVYIPADINHAVEEWRVEIPSGEGEEV